MTADPRLERNLPAILADLGAGPAPDYVDSLLARTEATRQRPGWVFPERWLPMDVVTPRVAVAPPFPWRAAVATALLIVGLIAGAVLVAGALQRPLPAPFGPAANGLVVFSWDGDIFVRDTLDGEPRAIIEHGPNDKAYDSFVGLSLDGTRIAFLRDESDPSTATQDRIEGHLPRDLWVARVDGGGQIRVGGPYTDVISVEWSPAGDQLAISWHRDGGDSVIELASADGSGTTRLDVGMPAEQPAWRPPDGSQLLFRGRTRDGWRLFLAGRDGSNPTQLELEREGVGDGSAEFDHPAWSPTGDRIAFVTHTRFAGDIDTPGRPADGLGLRLAIATVGPAGEVSAQQRLTSDERAEEEFDPIWLPDGSGIVFGRWFGQKETVWMAPADGPATDPTDLGLVSGGGFRVSVSPDGHEVLAANGNSYKLYRIDLSTLMSGEQFSVEGAASYQRIAP